ncbi:Transcription initiation factor TFIID subunit 13 [Chlorella sorokiniana]|uniref:Transcription initiation factor TFIID subunit 13 n=1 Tax=Chlorella sorokiniana TaxID=3076 RepID=A0A2P6TEZ6_CHLSO|nr:Transcription initiation factor TFIID subunit 13 [Chlorella sorokiniana]|eukprot:PRW32548.1 Transcription initiation factor TFIID subunit 13 [Chlorella sorokiniana]
MALPRGASSALLRRAASQAALNGERSHGSTADAAPDADPDSPPAAARPAPGGLACRRLVVRCMLLLHTALVASVLLATVTSITSRQQRSRELAQRLLEGGGGEAPSSWVPPVNSTALRQCGEALELPQVALLFLVKGPFHHETLWRLCFPAYPPGSLFHGRELPQKERVVTEWGQHSLVDAARTLLRAAYRNPRVTKFALMSESDLPLYSPHLLYTQLVSERLSRINACNTTRGWRLFEHRWVDRMATHRLKEHHWRKSWQWFALTREHVELILNDTEVDGALRAHCRTMWEPERKDERECYSDEHVFPTVLAMHGRDNETDCQGWLMDTDWSRVPRLSPHPYEYPADEVTNALLHRLRRPHLPGCSHAATAAATAAGGFLPASSLQAAGTAGTAGAAALTGVCLRLEQQLAMHRARHRPLGPQCRLLARKFLNYTAEATLAAVAPCDSSALVLNKGVCPFETPLQAGTRRRWQHTAPLALLLGSTLLLLPPLAALLLAAVGSAAAGRHRE